MSRKRLRAGKDARPTPLLISPLNLGSLTLSRRLVVAPMDLAKAHANGMAGSELCGRLHALASRGHVALVETGHHFVSPEGRAAARQPSIADDRMIEGLRREAQAVHQESVPVLIQLSHAGSAANERLIGQRPLGPSTLLCPGAKRGHPLPREMTSDDIARVIDAFAQAARRAAQASFDGVELHAAHGYLLDQFLSPLTNQRTDSYGGNLAGRAKLLLEVLGAVRSELPAAMVLSVRLGGCDYLPGGNSIDDAVAPARVVNASQAPDLVSVSGGMCYYSRIDHDEPGWFKDSSTPIRAAIDVPVLLAGGVRRSSEAEGLLAEGACDLVGVGRSIANNPLWAERELSANFSHRA